MTNHLTSPCYLFGRKIGRRSLLTGLATAGGALALGNRALAMPDGVQRFSALKSAGQDAQGHIRYAHLHFDDPVETMRTRVRLEFGTADGNYAGL